MADWVIGPPIQARLLLTDMHVTGPLEVVSCPACQSSKRHLPCTMPSASLIAW